MPGVLSRGSSNLPLSFGITTVVNSSSDPLGKVSREYKPICQHCTETNGKLMMICFGCSFLRCLEFRDGDFSKLDVYPTQMWWEEKYVLQQKISPKKSSFAGSQRLTQAMKDSQ